MSRQDITLDDIAAALSYLDCTNTDVWLRAGMAIKSEFGDAGFDVWDQWSRGDDRYKTREAKARWKSFKGGSARGKVSLGSVLHWAFERGFSIDRPELTPEQKIQFAKEQEERRKQLAEQWAREEAEILRWYDVVAEACGRLMPMLKPTGNSPYLGKKRVGAHGALFAPCSFIVHFKPDFSIDIIAGPETKKFFESRSEDDVFLYFKRGSILIPLRDQAGNLRNFQVIYNDGKTKRFFTNGQKSGLHFVVGCVAADDSLPVAFCEGFATGASIHECTGWPVIVCFDAGNLPVVAESFAQLGGVKIVAGDNDWETALDPKKQNTGVVKAKEAAAVLGCNWCVPQFSGDAAGLSDFNDLHHAEGADVVRQQLEAWLYSSPDVPAQSSPDSPPDYGDIPPPDYDVPDGSPSPSLNERPGLEQALKRYALAMPDAKVWDSLQKKVLKQGAFKAYLGAKLFSDWLGHDERRTVDLADVQRELAAAQAKGAGGLAQSLRRYIYLYPSSTAWDTESRQQVALGDLRNAIADCYDQWLKHPERRELPKENLVFDPTQRVDPETHINMFRGLPLTPVRNDDACRSMRHMLWCLCNKDNSIFTWLCKWLAYPVQHPGAKMQTAVLMHSRVHGSGKSFFFDGVMRAVYGEYCRTFGQAELESAYNDWISQALFGVFEEVLSRSQRYSHTGTLKQMITGQKVRINQKYMQGWEESNHLNCVFLSNEVEPLPVEPSDRRLLVIWPEEKLMEKLQMGVDEEIKAGGAAAFHAWLLSVDTSDFGPHSKPPMTDAKQRLIDIGRPAWEVFYDDWKNERTDAPYITCRVIDLYKVYQHWARQRNENVLAMNRFSGYIASYQRRRPDLHYQCGSFVGKSPFFIVGECPHDKNQGEWLGGCVAEFDRILQKNNQEAA